MGFFSKLFGEKKVIPQVNLLTILEGKFSDREYATIVSVGASDWTGMASYVLDNGKTGVSHYPAPGMKILVSIKYPKIDPMTDRAAWWVTKPNGEQIQVTLQEAMKIKEEIENGK